MQRNYWMAAKCKMHQDCNTNLYFDQENVCSAVKDKIVWECPTSEYEYEKVSKDMNCTTLCGADYQFHCIRDNRHQNLHYICAISTKIIGK